MIDQAIIQRIKYLFAVAENDASADGEIENALRAARNLMNAHQISRDDVFESEDGSVNTDEGGVQGGPLYLAPSCEVQ